MSLGDLPEIGTPEISANHPDHRRGPYGRARVADTTNLPSPTEPGARIAAIDDLTELVERAAAAEKVAVSSRWKDRPDVVAMITRVRRTASEQRDELTRAGDPLRLTSRLVSLRQGYVNLGAQDALPGRAVDPDTPGDDLIGRPAVPRLSRAAAEQAERDAVAAVDVARMALTDAALAVLQARLARIDAGEDDPDAATPDGHVPLHGKNPVSRHGPALAHGVTGEVNYILTRKPRGTVKSLAIALALGLLYLGWIRLAQWDQKSVYLPYLGLWVMGVVMGGGVCINAMSFDAMRVRAALDSGERLWRLLVIKNLALLCLVAPIGFILCALLAWRAGDIYAFYKACALMVCMIMLWLGVGNVLSIVLPSRDEPLRQRRQSGSLKQFIIAFVVSYAIGYLVNAMLIWRVFAARELTERLGNATIPAILIMLSSTTMWVLLTVLAVALSQQPRIRRVLQREITDYKANAEMRAYEQEAAARAASTQTRTAADTGRN